MNVKRKFQDFLEDKINIFHKVNHKWEKIFLFGDDKKIATQIRS